MDDYADRYLEYDSGQRVTEQVLQGAGCSVCTGGLASYAFSYTTSTFADGYNTGCAQWMTPNVGRTPISPLPARTAPTRLR